MNDTLLAIGAVSGGILLYELTKPAPKDERAVRPILTSLVGGVQTSACRRVEIPSTVETFGGVASRLTLALGDYTPRCAVELCDAWFAIQSRALELARKTLAEGADCFGDSILGQCSVGTKFDSRMFNLIVVGFTHLTSLRAFAAGDVGTGFDRAPWRRQGELNAAMRSLATNLDLSEASRLIGQFVARGSLGEQISGGISSFAGSLGRIGGNVTLGLLDSLVDNPVGAVAIAAAAWFFLFRG
jgi:hypothetical protein